MTTLASVSTSSTAATYGSAQIHRLHHARRHDGDDDDAPKVERSDGPGRRNPLVAAMMSALQSLVPAPASGTPATAPAATDTAAPAASTGTATPTATTPAADPAATLRDAAYAFAHELYNALRGNGGGSDEGRGEGHHHHQHGRHGGGYGDLAQRLTALATTLEGGATTPAPAAATPTPPAAAPGVDTPAAPATVAETPATTPATATTNINITININLGGTLAAGPATPPAAPASPLVDAFKNLLTALGNAGDGASSPTERLTAFLRTMAQSLSSSKDASAPAAPASGGLLNVSA